MHLMLVQLLTVLLAEATQSARELRGQAIVFSTANF